MVMRLTLYLGFAFYSNDVAVPKGSSLVADALTSLFHRQVVLFYELIILFFFIFIFPLLRIFVVIILKLTFILFLSLLVAKLLRVLSAA